MDQIESVLMWLKLQGANDATRVELNNGLKVALPFESFDNTIAPPDMTGHAVAAGESAEKPRWYDRWWVPTSLGLFMIGTSAVGMIRLAEMVAGA